MVSRKAWLPFTAGISRQYTTVGPKRVCIELYPFWSLATAAASGWMTMCSHAVVAVLETDQRRRHGAGSGWPAQGGAAARRATAIATGHAAICLTSL